MDRPVRIGRIDYTNVWPLFYYFPLAAFGDELEIVQQLPTGLNRAMAAGDIDIGPISSFAYGEHFDDYILFPHMSVSALGRVHSLLLFHREPLSQLDGKHVALTTASATTVVLLKIILQKFYGVKPVYTPMEPNLDEMMKEADAALLIGDHAIRASWADQGYMVTDLGAEWHKHTGEWMSFAVCTMRRALAESRPELVKRIYDAFLESKTKSLSDLTGLVQDACAKIGGSSRYWTDYFSNLCYEFGPRQWTGLKRYYDYAAELGFLDREVTLHIWNDTTTVQVTE